MVGSRNNELSESTSLRLQAAYRVLSWSRPLLSLRRDGGTSNDIFGRRSNVFSLPAPRCETFSFQRAVSRRCLLSRHLSSAVRILRVRVRSWSRNMESVSVSTADFQTSTFRHSDFYIPETESFSSSHRGPLFILTFVSRTGFLSLHVPQQPVISV